jgi:hypothetical protein
MQQQELEQPSSAAAAARLWFEVEGGHDSTFVFREM